MSTMLSITKLSEHTISFFYCWQHPWGTSTTSIASMVTLTREHCSIYFDTHQVEQHTAGIDTERDIEKHKEKRWLAEFFFTLLRLHPLLFAYLILQSWMSESVIYLWSHRVLDEKWICLVLKQNWCFVLYHTAHCFAPWLVFNFTHYVLERNPI